LERVQSGNAKIRAHSKGFEKDMPLLFALVDLDEGVRMFTTLVQCDHAKLKIGDRIDVVFEDATDAVTLPKFKPVARS
jgi:uncharacterized protein